MKRLFRADSPTRQRVIQRLAEILRGEPSVAFAYLHGSFLLGTGFHDIDVGVYLDLPLGERTARILDLSVRLSERVGFPVDVRALNDAPVGFVFHALRGQPVAIRNEERLADVIERTVPRYLDLEPLLRRSTVEAFSQ